MGLSVKIYNRFYLQSNHNKMSRIVGGLFFLAIIEFREGGPFPVWLLIKLPIAFILFIISYVLAEKVANEEGNANSQDKKIY